MTEVHIHLRFEGGEADSGRLPLYDAGQSLEGTARTVNIIAHSFANNQVLRTRAATAEGVQAYVHAPKKGCFEERIDLVFSDLVTEKIGSSVITGHFWDYFVFCLASATGQEYEPQTPYLRKILDGTDAFVDAVAQSVESPLAQMQRPVGMQDGMTLNIARDRVGDLIQFDKSTYEHVAVQNTSKTDEYFIGNVTKLNGISGVGRAYLREFGETVPFLVNKRDKNQRTVQAAGASLHEYLSDPDNDGGGERTFRARRVHSAHGRLIRLLVDEINVI